MTKSRSATARFSMRTLVVDLIWWLVSTTMITRVFPMTPRNAMIPKTTGTITVVSIWIRLSSVSIYFSSSTLCKVEKEVKRITKNKR